ncbi:cupin domain-containing protein [Actinocorallia sp. API 0066]|uniref:cupin domain-containing protein n=1 Tax=Actinocorallia sp. API 0066 TaxID=2896846 RepID=UPI001E563ABC|nr:cupin domain-containing protein [Actinocorallia sp. API 0066]MCD0453398.1 cupin domain-containing protein [Actinocorallia sp. API 0066]
MPIQPRLVVTGGASAVLADAPAVPVSVAAAPGVEFYPLWGTGDGVPTVGPKPAEPVTLPFFAGPGGTRLLLARYAPASTVTVPSGDPAELRAEADAVLPGLMDPFPPGADSGMHTTDTLDYAVCLEGELWLETGDGTEVLLTPGTCVVQQGAAHAWHNRGDVPALMCFVGIGAVRER